MPELAEVKPQWPIVGRGDIYYGGTTYENTQGLGAHLSAGGDTRGNGIRTTGPERGGFTSKRKRIAGCAYHQTL